MLADSVWNLILGMPQIIFVVGGLIAIAAIVCSFWYKVEKVRSDKDLKLSMLQRGMSGEEIERVIHARAQNDEK